ncbi:NAD(P)-dependent oxidoreductase [Streptomyces sp. URMC 123]|uniref:NAD(P)-dependent oxidoreductase n=1 Tax=Streptomyces sp. URMC 123 TaxID=3423403 RepID=UPI003F19D3D0
MSRPAVLIAEGVRREGLLHIAADVLGPDRALGVWGPAGGDGPGRPDVPVMPGAASGATCGDAPGAHGAPGGGDAVEALIVDPGTRVDAAAIEAFPRLRVIAVAGERTANVDLAAATRAGATVVRSPLPAGAAAEAAAALLLAVARHAPGARPLAGAGARSRSLAAPAGIGTSQSGTGCGAEEEWTGGGRGVELAGKTLGIIGFGAVGESLAPRMSAFGMRVLAYEPDGAPRGARPVPGSVAESASEPAAGDAGPMDSATAAGRAVRAGAEAVGLDELLQRADLIAVLPTEPGLVPGLLGERELRQVTAGARLVDTARGGVVDEAALLDAVRRGRIAAVGVPVPDGGVGVPSVPGGAEADGQGVGAGADADGWSWRESALLRHPAVVVAPGADTATTEALRDATAFAARAVARALDGEPVTGAVNAPVGEVPEEARPWLALADRLGRLVAGLAGPGPLRRLDVAAEGGPAAAGAAAVRLAALTGALRAETGSELTPVAALALAERRAHLAEGAGAAGGVVPVTRRPDAEGAAVPRPTAEAAVPWPAGESAVLRLTAVADGAPVSVAATVDEGRPAHRLVEIDGHAADLVLDRHLVVLRRADAPGVLGTAAAVLADAGVDICAMQVMRGAGGTCLVALSVASAVSDTALADVVAAVDAERGWALDLGESPSRPERDSGGGGSDG